MIQAHLLKGFINISCGFEELLGEHVDVALPDIMRHLVLSRLAMLHLPFMWWWLTKIQQWITPDALVVQLKRSCRPGLTFTAVAADAETGAAAPECVAAKLGVNDLRASAGISMGAVERVLCRGPMAGNGQDCFTVTMLVCMELIGVSTGVTGMELEVTGKVLSGRIKCKLLPTSMTVVPRGM